VRVQDLKVEIRNKNKGKNDPAGRPFASARGNNYVACEGQRTRLGEKAAERKESFSLED